MTITIIGAGNTAAAAACHMAGAGLPVSIYVRRREKAAVWEKESIHAEGALTGDFSLPVVTTLAEAARADILIIATLAVDHAAVAGELRPYLHPGQCVLFLNGCWGALQACRLLAEEQRRLDLTIGETANMPYIAGLSADLRTVTVKGVKAAVSFSAVGSGKEMIRTLLERLYHTVHEEPSLAATSLGATNPIVHVTASLFNVTRIENGEDFLFFGAPMTQRVVAYMEQVDRERTAIGRALGLTLPSLLDVLNSFWDAPKATLYEALTENPSYRVSKGPQSLGYRYLAEDLPCGIQPLVDLGHRLGVAVPYAEALAGTASLYLGMRQEPFLTEEDVQWLRGGKE